RAVSMRAACGDGFDSAPTVKVAVSSALPGRQSFSHSNQETFAFRGMGPLETLAPIDSGTKSTTSLLYVYVVRLAALSTSFSGTGQRISPAVTPGGRVHVIAVGPP